MCTHVRSGQMTNEPSAQMWPQSFSSDGDPQARTWRPERALVLGLALDRSRPRPSYLGYVSFPLPFT